MAALGLTSDEDSDLGFVHVVAGADAEFTFSVDGEMWGNASYDTTVRLSPGLHKIKLVGRRGETCSAEVRIRSGQTESLECVLPKRGTRAALEIGTHVTPPLDLPTRVTLSRSASDFDGAIHELAESCSVNVVMRAGANGVNHIARDSMINADNVRCDEVIAALLESRGLSYFYNADAHLIRIDRREGLFASAAPDEFRGQLPPGHRASLNVTDEDVRQVLEQIVRGEHINLIVPKDVRGRVTARLKDVPWNQAFEAVLESQGLWFHYGKASNTLTVLVNTNVGPPPSTRFERFRSEGDP
jgi:hypothetical protein